MRTIARWITAAALALGATFACTQAVAQDQQQEVAKLTGFWLTTPHPELAIRPGETEAIPLTLRNANLPPQRASLEVTGIPDGWEWTLKGGNREVSAVIVAPDATQEINLELTPPETASGEGVPINVKARYANQTIDLPLVVKLSQAAEGGLELKSELPALRGTASSTFSFKIEATNHGAEENLFSLAANVPEGFQSRSSAAMARKRLPACRSRPGQART